MIELDYKDTVQLVKHHVSSDGYATEIVDQIVDVAALFIEDVGWQHGGHQTAVNSNAEVYLDPCDEFIQANYNRLDGMLVIANRYGNVESQQWYRIIEVIIGEDKLLGNGIDNINCQLKKTTEIPYVS